ncbi:MAG: molybdopterin-dependent oxidoreductase, partial [Desulfobacterales bacterium]|nr:molybdopterin-dependent oxidoreductase [Desulfobacterales bacterium]
MDPSIPIICPYCGVGCNLELHLDDDGCPVRGKASGRNPGVNHKYLCVKGLAIPEFINHGERLTRPAIRENGVLKPVSWDGAVAETARRLKQVIDTHGPESVGMLSSSKILNEEAYLCQKFQRQVVGSNNIDNCARLCHGPSEAGLRQQLGYGATSLFYEDFDQADTFFLTGAHTTFTHPIVWLKVKKNLKNRDTRLILADPRKTDLVKSARIHLPARPGTDIYWINALCKIILDAGMEDKNFCRFNTLGFTALKNKVKDLDVDGACAVAGVNRADLEEAAEYLCGRRTIFIWGMGLTQHSHGTDNVHALTNLALLTGNIGKPGTGVAPLRGQNNVQGACDMGALPNLLPGHMLVDDEAARTHVEALWGGKLSDFPGLSAPEMLHGVASGKIRALYVVGENPVVSEPQSTFASWMLQ